MPNQERSPSAPDRQALEDKVEQLGATVQELVEFFQADILARIKLNGPEIVTDPESQDFIGFYKLLSRNFVHGEIEPLSVFQREMTQNGSSVSPAKFICVVAKDPLTRDREVVSGAYGSLLQGGVLAMRFTVTEAGYLGHPPAQKASERGYKGLRSYRGTGISQEVDRVFLETAQRIALEQGSPIKVFVCEAVDRSESYWNKLKIEPGNSMRRLYIPYTSSEMFYRLPPLEWNKDGYAC